MDFMPVVSPPVERFLYAQPHSRERPGEDREIRAQGVGCAECAALITACTMICIATCTFAPELCDIRVEECVEASDQVCVTCI